MEIQERIIKFVTRTNWYIFVVASILGFINTPFKFAMGILCGGLIVTINFHMMQRTIKKTLKPLYLKMIPNKTIILKIVLVKYYIRFVLSGFIIFLLISKNIVNPLGLLAGLSIVVISILVATILELTRLITKEAV